MTREEFDRILDEEGILSQRVRDNLWQEQIIDNTLERKRLQQKAMFLKKHFPQTVWGINK